ncbi:MAG: TolC family protein [Myxococcales bacterium]
MHAHLAALLALQIVAGADAGGDPLDTRADLPSLVARALAHNPDLAADRERVHATGLKAKAAGGFPDLSLRYQFYNAPLERPWDAEMHMVGLEQEFPAYGVRGARERAGKAEAQSLEHQRRARALDVVNQLHKAYADLLRVDRERRIREEHVQLAQRIVELARANYQSGRVSQQDVLRAGVELSRLKADFASLDQARTSAVALVNALVGRAVDAPLGELAELPAPPQAPEASSLDARVEARPELASIDSSVARSQADLDAARKSGLWPSVMVGLDYVYNPMGEHSQHGFSAMLSVNLPWLNPRHGEEVAAAERAVAADRSTRDAALVTARLQLRDALARYRAARETFTLLERDLVPQAKQSYEAAEAAFASNQADALGLLDAERSLLQVRIDRERALAQLQSGWADVERATGAMPHGIGPSGHERPTKDHAQPPPAEERRPAGTGQPPGSSDRKPGAEGPRLSAPRPLKWAGPRFDTPASEPLGRANAAAPASATTPQRSAGGQPASAAFGQIAGGIQPPESDESDGTPTSASVLPESTPATAAPATTASSAATIVAFRGAHPSESDSASQGH